LLQDRLSDVANNNGKSPTSPISNYDAESEVDEEKKRQFLEYRKKHYNEMDLVRQFREKHPDDSFEDDDDQVTSLKVHNDIG
jgi:Protein phosphatase inhibitor 2 (IPP-2)